MTEKLDDQSRAQMVKYRIEKAYEAIKESEFCAKGEMYILAINRLYYACYYIASALTLHNNLSCVTHKGVKTMLNLHFVNTGLLDKNIAKTLSTLYESRQSGDYEDFVYYEADDYELLKPKALQFIEEIKKLIK